MASLTKHSRTVTSVVPLSLQPRAKAWTRYQRIKVRMAWMIWKTSMVTCPLTLLTSEWAASQTVETTVPLTKRCSSSVTTTHSVVTAFASVVNQYIKLITTVWEAVAIFNNKWSRLQLITIRKCKSNSSRSRSKTSRTLFYNRIRMSWWRCSKTWISYW
jgi:hypothetical protein